MQADKRRVNKRWVLGVLIALLLVLSLAAGLVYVVDPFQHYRAMTLMTPVVDSKLQAYYNVGMARNYDYDTLLVGSSVTENTSTKLVEELFGGTAINLPFSGGTLPAFARMLDAAFETRQLSRVFICLDNFAVAGEPEETNMDIPNYLYDHNPLTDVYYLLSWDSITKVVELIQYNRQADTPDQLDLDKLYYWGDQTTFNARRTLLSFGTYNGEFMDPFPTEGKVWQMTENINRYLRPYIEAHPETEFYLYFPPYSSLQWYSERVNGMLDRQLFYRSFYTEQLLAFQNVKLFDFQANVEWVEDLEQYKDMAHYAPWINDAMIEAMAADDFLITDLETLEANNGRIRQISYDFEAPSQEQLQQWLEMVY